MHLDENQCQAPPYNRVHRKGASLTQGIAGRMESACIMSKHHKWVPDMFTRGWHGTHAPVFSRSFLRGRELKVELESSQHHVTLATKPGERCRLEGNPVEHRRVFNSLMKG